MTSAATARAYHYPYHDHMVVSLPLNETHFVHTYPIHTVLASDVASIIKSCVIVKFSIGQSYNNPHYCIISWHTPGSFNRYFVERRTNSIYINKSIIYDGSLHYKSKHLPPRYDKRGYLISHHTHHLVLIHRILVN